MSTLRVDNLRGQTADGTNRYVVQVVHTNKTSSFSTTSTTFTDVTGLSATITPQSVNNKILVTLSTVTGDNTGSRMKLFNIVRGSTNIGQPDSAGSVSSTRTVYDNVADTAHMVHATVLDSPATTSATTYKVQCRINSAGTMYVGTRQSGDAEQCSTLTLMEIAQ